jgi:peptidoglycan/xylan/chitin deacetylase (PgdA/CDA1 family)
VKPTVFIPAGRAHGRRWAVQAVMTRLLDHWDCHDGDGPNWAIRCGDTTAPAGQTLRLPDIFLATPQREWLTERSLPSRPMSMMTPARFGLDPVLTSPDIPIIFGDGHYRDHPVRPAELGIDIFGSAFFMLSRYEELVIPESDSHDRFPSSASIARACGFLGRPIIDEYVEILWSAMARLWPNLRRKPARFQVKPSHDVDEPSRDAFRDLKEVLKESAGDVLKRRNFGRACQGPWHWLHGQWALHPKDPYNTFDRLMDLSEEIGTKSTFYFMTGCTNPAYDRGYSITHSAVRRLMRRIHDRGHEIGLHPSYETYCRPDLVQQEADRLRKALRIAGVRQETLGARMHYLRWRCPATWRAMVSAGIDHDATLGFADSVGFRCGTCHDYTAFDVHAERAIDLRVRPLIAMDGSILDTKYMGLGISSGAQAVLGEMRRCCERVRGSFSLLWHNNEFQRAGAWDLYRGVTRSGKLGVQ